MGSWWSRLLGEHQPKSSSKLQASKTSVNTNNSNNNNNNTSNPPVRERSRGRTRTRTRTPPPFKETPVNPQSSQPETGSAVSETSMNLAITNNFTSNVAPPNTANNNNTTTTKQFTSIVNRNHSSTPHEFVWKYGGSKVILTGTFDEWQQSTTMVRDPTGCHKATIDLDPSQKWIFKFVVDGIWRCSLDFATETDALGNVNNVIYPD